MGSRGHPEGSEPFDVTLPDLGEHESALDTAAMQAGWTVERDGSVIVVRDVWTENEDHAAWLVATKVGLPLEQVTEAEVADLVAEGLTNKQIGARLFISEHTVDTHIRSILSKLGVHSRSQIAAWIASSNQ
jgi:DNA-binding CsgD family transcriptional regulator